MSNISRTIGRNIQELMYKKNMPIEVFSKVFDFDRRDSYRIIEGRCFLPPRELKRICDYFNVDMGCFLKEQENYNIPSLQYVNDFQDKENLDLILDLMDDYIELLEVI